MAVRTPSLTPAGRTPSLNLTVIPVRQGQWSVGEIVLSADERVLRAGRDIPRDVVFKILVAVTRHDEVSGQVRGRKDRLMYHWQVFGSDDC
jgi:hypothetical protein